MTKPISEETRLAVLEAAWQLMAGGGRLAATMTEIAEAAGVSRQTLFYAFGNRAGLLVAMVRHRDAQGTHVPRLAELARGDGADAGTLLEFVDVWLDYLPHVYPVAIQMEMDSVTDGDAEVAWNDRFVVKGVRRGLELILGRMAAAGKLPKGVNPTRLADACLSLVAPSAWRLLVVDFGWKPAAFIASRHALIAALLAQRPAR